MSDSHNPVCFKFQLKPLLLSYFSFFSFSNIFSLSFHKHLIKPYSRRLRTRKLKTYSCLYVKASLKYTFEVCSIKRRYLRAIKTLAKRKKKKHEEFRNSTPRFNRLKILPYDSKRKGFTEFRSAYFVALFYLNLLDHSTVNLCKRYRTFLDILYKYTFKEI